MPCDSPVWIKVKGQDVPVPCLKCPPCKVRRVNEWVFRLMWEEERNSTSSHFVTLTYDTRFVPLTPHGFMSLRKVEFQKYMKRLRKLCPDQVLRYFACGEYGYNEGRPYGRPHYHMICFNCPDSDLFAQAWSLDGQQLGMVDVGTCTTNSTAYCLKYIDKDSFKQKVWRHSRDDREQEFQLMSKGLGESYIHDPSIRRYHKADLTRNYLTKLGGYRVAMPRYYRLKLFTEQELEDQRDIIGVAVQVAEEEARQRHISGRKCHTWQQELEFQRQGRAVKFALRAKNRNSF